MYISVPPVERKKMQGEYSLTSLLAESNQLSEHHIVECKPVLILQDEKRMMSCAGPQVKRDGIAWLTSSDSSMCRAIVLNMVV